MKLSKQKAIKTYKILEADYQCMGYKYRVGKIYTYERDIKICQSGFHGCKKLEDCFSYYSSVSWNHIVKCKQWGEVQTHSDDSKVCSSKIEIVEEIEWSDIGNYIRGGNNIRGGNDIRGGNNIWGGNYIWGGNNIWGLSHGIFCNKKKPDYLLFNKKVSIDRFNEVWNKINELSNDWYPKYNNAYKLYDQFGREWRKTPVDRIENINNKEAWSDIPKELKKYIKSLSEYNAEIFKDITE